VVLIVLGLVIWSAVHLIPAAAPALKTKWVQTLGPNGYKGSFSLLIIIAVVLMVMGWRHSLPIWLYTLSDTIDRTTIGIMAFAAVLFVAAKLPTRIKRIIRHPQLTGVALWALAHLLANGDSRSVTLFGGLLLWSIVEITLINRREGPWIKPPASALIYDLIVLALGAVLFSGLIFVHPYLSGVKLGS